jgi:ribonuclease III
MDINQLQINLGYKFQDVHLLKTAITHKSYLGYRKKDKTIVEHNERLEFLGDAVLELVVTEYLFTKFSKNEGFMTSLRAALVNYKIIGEVGNEMGLDEAILLSPAEKAELGKARLTIVADGMEAVIGAIFLDGGYESAGRFIHEFILSKLPDIIEAESFRDGKTEMQEFCQKIFKTAPKYVVLSTEGPDHSKVFEVGVFVGSRMYASATGKSKQDAETEAAVQALNILKQDPNLSPMIVSE